MFILQVKLIILVLNLIHPFSDVFSALVQNGGVDNTGSLRNVKLN